MVIGADTRSTSNLVVDKNCEKIHYIAPNIYCCGAGTAADTEFTTAQISSQLELLRLNSGKQSRVVTALTMLKRHLFQYQGHVSAALVLGGVDATGPHLHTIYPHGSIDSLPFVSMGSGSLAAMSVLETGYQDNMSKEDCVKLVARAIRSGVVNDLGSGSNVDYCILEGVRDNEGKFRVNMEFKRGSEKPDGQHEVARRTVEENEVQKYKDRVALPNYFANFPVGTSITVGDPIIEKFE